MPVIVVGTLRTRRAGRTRCSNRHDRSKLAARQPVQHEAYEVRAPCDVRDGSSARLLRLVLLVSPSVSLSTSSSPQRFDRLPRRSRAGRYLVTRGHGRRGPRRAQFRSAPSSEHAPRQVSSSPIVRVRAARGLFEHGEAHRRACPRGRAFSSPPPPYEAPHHLLEGRELVNRVRDPPRISAPMAADEVKGSPRATSAASLPSMETRIVGVAGWEGRVAGGDRDHRRCVRETGGRHPGVLAPPAYGFSTRNVAKISPMRSR
jgi:hypothetical protein